MKIITAPKLYKIYDWFNHDNIFIAGGISNCPDWQNEFIELVSNKLPDTAVLYNPRRFDFDVSNPKDSEIQISRWLYSHEISDVVVFWFPEETLCPITLFELGKMLMTDKKLVIGVHPNYKRKFDVEYQTKLMGDYEIVYSIQDLADKLVKICSE